VDIPPGGAGSRSQIFIPDQKSWIQPSSRDGSAVRVTRGPPGGTNVKAQVFAESGHGTVTADSMQPAQVSALLDRYGYQELSVPRADSRFNVPQAIRRSFHDEKPPAGARPIKITGIKGAPGAVTAHV